jgi:hypothetical protein
MGRRPWPDLGHTIKLSYFEQPAVPSGFVLEFDLAQSPGHDVIGSGGEVNWLVDGRCSKRLPAVDLAHVDLAGGKQRPEQHGGGLC